VLRWARREKKKVARACAVGPEESDTLSARNGERQGLDCHLRNTGISFINFVQVFDDDAMGDGTGRGHDVALVLHVGGHNRERLGHELAVRDSTLLAHAEKE
jgi:hypothetical protein